MKAGFTTWFQIAPISFAFSSEGVPSLIKLGSLEILRKIPTQDQRLDMGGSRARVAPQERAEPRALEPQISKQIRKYVSVAFEKSSEV